MKWRWYITEKAITEAAYLLGFPTNLHDADESWAYLEDLLGGLSWVATRRREYDEGVDLYRVGAAHKELQLLVSTDHTRGLPKLITVLKPHARWRRPRSPLRLPVPSPSDAQPAQASPSPAASSPDAATAQPERYTIRDVLMAHLAVLDEWPRSTPKELLTELALEESSALDHIDAVETRLLRRRN